MESFFREASSQSAQDYAYDKASIRQEKIFSQIREVSRAARSFLRNDFDTLLMLAGLKEIEGWRRLSGDGVFENKGSAQTSRNLSATYNILKSLDIQVKSYKRQVDSYHDQLISYRLNLDSLSNDESLFVFSQDSAQLSKYVSKLRLLSQAVSPVNKQLAANINSIQSLQNKVDLEVLTIENNIEEVQFYQSQIAQRGLSKEFATLWEKSKYDRDLREIFYYSILKAKLVFRYYVKAHLAKFFLFGLVLFCITTYIYSLRKQTYPEIKGILLSLPFISSLVISLAIGQFIFPNPPFVFSTLLLTSAALLLTICFRKFISHYWMFIWIGILFTYLFSSTDNLVLQASRPERYAMAAISLLAICVSTISIFNRRRYQELQERWILYPIGLMGLVEMVAFLLNLLGYYNVSKALMVAGLQNVVVAIVFLWVLRLVNEGLTLASQLYVRQDSRLFFINYNRVGRRAPLFFYVLLTIGWIVLMGRNFYQFRFFTDPFNSFLYDERHLGSYTFSVINIIIFFVIMLGATVISKIISFFAEDPQWNVRNKNDGKGVHLGSWILIVRISIIILGVILAFSAVGIPLQQVTLIIGALGVGIGFGLQTLVNNLVSGLIIAVERPVNVDDIIDIGGQSGKVKSIGFRSSVIATADGANLIMPNGDLLNSHVVNWSLGGAHKRLQIALQLEGGTDLDRTKTLLMQILHQHTKVLKDPTPFVVFSGITARSVSVEIYFWVAKSKDAAEIKSAIIISILATFQQNNVSFAMPQQEIYFSSGAFDTQKSDENKEV